MLRKSFIIFLLQTIVYNISIAQKDSLNYTIGSYGIFHYELNKKEISKQKFYQYLAKNDVALKTFKSGKKIINTGNVLAYAGGFMIGYNIGSALFLKKKDYTIGVVGLCLAGLSFPIYKKGTDNTKKALQLFHAHSDPSLTLPDKKVSSTKNSEDRQVLDESCIIVRVPVYAAKINFLKNKLKNTSLSGKAKQSLQITLDDAIHENEIFIRTLQNSFENYFSFKDVYFLPDSLFKQHLNGEHTGFLNNKGSLDPNMQCTSEHKFYFIAGKDKEQLLFVDKNLQKPDAPIPYRKVSFLPSFQKIFNRDKYIDNQIIYFNNKLLQL